MTTQIAPAQDKSHETLVSYGHLRGHYLQSDMGAGHLHIRHFLRPEYVTVIREQLLADRALLTTSPNTRLQTALSPVSRQCLWELQSGIMLRVLENITGLSNLLPDTHCKQSGLLLPPVTQAGIGDWQDADTGLAAVLVLVIQLDTGDAELCTRPDTLHKTGTGSAALQITYWHHDAANAGDPA